MRFARFQHGGREGLAVDRAPDTWHGLTADDARFPGFIERLLADQVSLQEAHSRLAAGPRIEMEAVTLLPPLRQPPKIICVGLNYADHAAESAFERPSYPALFSRFGSSLIGHRQPLIRPKASTLLDYEGELVAVIGRGGRAIDKASALEHVAGWSIFNDASIRDFQFKSTQWTIGKNFDGTGAFGPWLVTPDEIPPGGAGLKLQTRLNGQVVQEASTDELIFDVPTLISLISVALTLEPGDLIVTGTPAGVGLARKPPLWMKSGDTVEVEIERIGTLSNRVYDEE